MSTERVPGRRAAAVRGRAHHEAPTWRAAFNPGSGWNVASIEPERVQTRFHDDGAPALNAAASTVSPS
jgi:hypothetical protein